MEPGTVKNMRRLMTAFVVALCLVAAAPGAQAANRVRERNFVFAINLPPSLMNEGSATIIEYSNRFRKVLRRKTGLNIEWRLHAGWDSVVSSLRKRQADFAALPAYQFAKTLSDPHSPIEPFLTFSGNDSIASPFCLYTKRGDKYFTIDHLLNTRLAIGDEDDWVLLNHIFEGNGIPFPPADFFDRIETMTPESAFSALIFNKVDAIFFDSLSMAYILEGNPKASGITAIECTSTLTNLLIVHRTGVDAQSLKKLSDALTNMHRDSDFSEFQRFLKATNGRWVESKATYYSDWEPIVAEAKKNGWDREFDKIARNSR